MNGSSGSGGHATLRWVVELRVAAGPDAGWCVDLRPGRHLVGRAGTCALTIDDPAVEAHHVLLEVDVDDRFDVIQLAGRLPIAVSPNHVELGDTRLDLRPSVAVGGLVLGVTAEALGSVGGAPVVLTADTLAIVDNGHERADAIVRSLRSQAAVLGIEAPECWLTDPDDPALEDCESILELGARWRARFGSIRLHVAGQTHDRIRPN